MSQSANSKVLFRTSSYAPDPVTAPIDKPRQPDRQKPNTTEPSGQASKSYAIEDEYDPPPKNSGYAKMAALARKQYLNPLARLDYEDREMEVYTKLTKQSQQTMLKKMKARNQLAEFQDQFDEDREIDDLVQFKFGKTLKPNERAVYYNTEDEQKRQSPPLKEEPQPPVQDLTARRHPEAQQLMVYSPIVPIVQQGNQLASSQLRQPQLEQRVLRTSQSVKSELAYMPVATVPPQQLTQPSQPLSRSVVQQQELQRSQVTQIQPPKQLYCASCQSILNQQQAEKHCRECYFDYSQDSYEKKEQIIAKLEKIYRNLGQLPQSQVFQRFRRILVDVTYTDDLSLVDEKIKQLSQLPGSTEMEVLLLRRAILCLREKLQLRMFTGPRLGIFKKSSN